MNKEQKDRFIQVAQMGVTCGLLGITEWYLNYMLHTMNFLPYDDIPKEEAITRNAFAQFFRETAGPDDPIAHATDEEVEAIIYRQHEALVERWRDKHPPAPGELREGQAT